MKITTDFHYDSAHYLPYVEDGHKCGFMHGHTYVLTVTVEGDLDDRGWVVDFADVKNAVQPLIAQLDHRLLNDVIYNPTVEVQLEWLWERINLPGVTELSLREGLNNAATYTGPQ